MAIKLGIASDYPEKDSMHRQTRISYNRCGAFDVIHGIDLNCNPIQQLAEFLPLKGKENGKWTFDT